MTDQVLKKNLHKNNPSSQLRTNLRTQECPVCKTSMGDMPGSRDAYCSMCGFKDPCCE